MTRKSKITVDELIRMKAELEMAIHAAVAMHTTKFLKDTGVGVSDVSVHIMSTRELGSSENVYLVRNVGVSLDLREK